MSDPLVGGRYEFVVGATLDPDWSEWFGLDVSPRDDTTHLSGIVADQAALHGILARLRDLGVPILVVRRVPRQTSD